MLYHFQDTVAKKSFSVLRLPGEHEQISWCPSLPSFSSMYKSKLDNFRFLIVLILLVLRFNPLSAWYSDLKRTLNTRHV